MVVRSDIEKLHKLAAVETQIRPELITEVDLGPFKHKVDEGIPIRKAAYSLFDTMVEKIPDRSDCNHITEIAIKGLDDPAEECMIICLHLLGRLINWAPAIVASNMDLLVESFEKQFQKNAKLSGQAQGSDKAQNIMRALLRVVEQLQRTQEIEGVGKFNEFFKTYVLENAANKALYEKIAATASQAIMDHF
jgi:cullin-associated NEDD8-dissociated protein 1